MISTFFFRPRTLEQCMILKWETKVTRTMAELQGALKSNDRARSARLFHYLVLVRSKGDSSFNTPH